MERDPAFLFYDGDAARDVSHMNRLERGCYFDLIQAQRKFGRMKAETIKKVLGKEYETCWPALEMSLSYVDDMYFIPWIEASTNKRREYAESRKKNRIGTKKEDVKKICPTYVEHMENEIENKKVINGKKVFDNKEVNNKVNNNSDIWLEKGEYKALKMLYPRIEDLAKHLECRGADALKAVELAKMILEDA